MIPLNECAYCERQILTDNVNYYSAKFSENGKAINVNYSLCGRCTTRFECSTIKKRRAMNDGIIAWLREQRSEKAEAPHVTTH